MSLQVIRWSVFLSCTLVAESTIYGVIFLSAVSSISSVYSTRRELYFAVFVPSFSACYTGAFSAVAFSALTQLVGWQQGRPACKKLGGWWRRALVSPDGVAPSRVVGVSASVNLPLHHKVQKFHPGGPGKRAIKRLWWWWWWYTGAREPA